MFLHFGLFFLYFNTESMIFGKQISSFLKLNKTVERYTDYFYKSNFVDILKWGYSSVGRAPALQAGGQGFESLYLHCGK